MNLEDFKATYAKNEAQFLEQWKEFLRFDSISTDPAYEKACVRCAEWLTRHLQELGFKSELLETATKPVVYAEYRPANATKTIVFYGHYDVQPVDPVADWKSKPFEPEVRDGRMYARGAQDNKGQLFYVVKALEILIRSGSLSCNVKLFIEGEEEFGSKSITACLPKWKERSQGDVLMVCDTGTIKAGLATITMGLRGIIACTVTVNGPKKDLHSGMHGGLVRNPATELARLLASLHNADGGIAVAGYYDGIEPIDPEDGALANSFPFSVAQYKEEVGASPLGGELAFSPLERNGFRPTIEVNGIHSGYGGPGSKTIIPSTAFAKITARTVAGQDPERCLTLIKKHLVDRTPQGVTVTISEESAGGGALRLSSKSEVIVTAREVLKEVSGVDPIFRWEGASIPIVASFAEVSGAEPLLVGFGLEDDNIHAPNESFALAQFKQGFLYACLFLSRI